MFTVRKPTEADIIAYLISRAEMPLTYGGPGLTHERSPRGFKVDRLRVLLGHGEDVFHCAQEAIRNWEMFPREMAELYWPDRPLREGTVVAALFRASCLWSLNPCRIVDVIDEVVSGTNSTAQRFGFTYGTLPGHLECGEERFCVERNLADGFVWYDLLAVSRPRHLLTWLGYPIVRRQQARFRRLSGEAMQRAVAASTISIPVVETVD